MNKTQANNAVRDIIGKLEEWSQSHTQKTNHDVVILTSHHVHKDKDFWSIDVIVYDGIHDDAKKLYYNSVLVSYKFTTQEKLEKFLNTILSWSEKQLQKPSKKL